MTLKIKEPLALFTLIVTIFLGVVNNDRIMSVFDKRLEVTIASKTDEFGRCIDSEVLLVNNKKVAAKNIKIYFDFDYIVKQGFVSISYGSAKDMLIPPGQQTLIPRQESTYVDYSSDSANDLILIPKLSPGGSIHLFYGGYSNVNQEKGETRLSLIQDGKEEFMDKPRVSTVLYDEGFVKVNRISPSGCR